MKVCAISFKECWQDEAGRWFSSGGFPLQMGAVGSLFADVTLVVTRVEPRAGGLPLPPGARVVALKPLAGSDLRHKIHLLAHAPYYLSRIVREVRAADVVHTPLPGDLPLLGMLAAVVLKKRTIARYGSSWVPTDQTTVFHRLTRRLMTTFAGGRNVMLATGEGTSAPGPRMRWVFATALSREELSRIRPGLDRGLSSPPRILYAGRLSPEKGVAVLIDAASRLARRGVETRVVLAGDGPQRGRLEALAVEKRCEGRVRFAGQLGRGALSAEMSAADLCVQPSLTEGFSKAWLDAMAHGLPVIASEVGAARAVLGGSGERGWLVPPGDPEVLAESIERALSEPRDWAALRRRCREYVENRTLESWAEAIGRICADQWGMGFVDGKLVA